MKNPHGIEPTRYRKRRGRRWAIECDPECGPVFGDGTSDIVIANNCNNEWKCLINNDGANAYECHPEYKSSLFVNTAGPDEENKFSLLDYEVFTIN